MLTLDVAKTVAVCILGIRLDYGNNLFYLEHNGTELPLRPVGAKHPGMRCLSSFMVSQWTQSLHEFYWLFIY